MSLGSRSSGTCVTMATSQKLIPVILLLALGVPWAQAISPQSIYPGLTSPIRLQPCPSFAYDAIYDLRNNITVTNPHVTLKDNETFKGVGCNTTGALKIALASAATDPHRRRVLLDFFFNHPLGWVFNVGDSRTNNGYAGDWGTNSWDAEVHGNDNSFFAWKSDHGPSGPAFNIPNLYTTRLTLIVGDGHAVWMSDNNNLFNYYYNSTFFALNGQDDPDDPPGNYDLYLGLNRVVDGDYRSGSGLCKVGIKFLPEYI